MLDILTNIGDTFLNPVVIQLVTALATVAAVLVAFYTAQRRSELAAAKVSFEISERRSHSLTLVDEPLQGIRPQMFSPDKVLIVTAYFPRDGPRLDATSSDFKARLEKDPNKKFLIAHLASGYPELYSALEDYDRLYNRIASDALSLYKDQLRRFEKIWTERGLTRVRIDSYSVIQALSEDISSEKRGSDPQIIREDSVNNIASNLRYGSRTFGGQSGLEAEVNTLQEFRNDVEFRKRWNELYSQGEDLFGKAEKIEDNLSLIQAYVRAGNFLKGHCDAGKDAGYEGSK